MRPQLKTIIFESGLTNIVSFSKNGHAPFCHFVYFPPSETSDSFRSKCTKEENTSLIGGWGITVRSGKLSEKLKPEKILKSPSRCDG